MGNILPLRLVSALSVALYGMFIAVFMPPTRKDKVIALLVVASMFLSWVFASAEVFSFMSEGARVIFLTVAISAAAAWLFPVKDEEVSA
jgi:predicted branched-subunit amino acid permease